MRLPPTSPLFPYTTLFRSVTIVGAAHCSHSLGVARQRRAHSTAVAQRAAACHCCLVLVLIRFCWRCCWRDRKSTRLNSSHGYISYAVFCLKKKSLRSSNRL